MLRFAEGCLPGFDGFDATVTASDAAATEMAWWARAGRLPRSRAAQLSTASQELERCLGIDIGGSLCKVAVFEPSGHTSAVLKRMMARMESGHHPGYDPQLAIRTEEGKYSFLRFESRWMDEFLQVLQSLHFPAADIRATGGGAFKVRKSGIRPTAAMHTP